MFSAVLVIYFTAWGLIIGLSTDWNAPLLRGVFVWRCMAIMYENFAVNISRSVQTVSLYRLNGRITLDNN